MLYERLSPLRFYRNQREFLLPKGIKSGFGNVVFMVSKSQEDTLRIMNTDFFGYRKSFYRNYYIDPIYREKIGRRRVVENNKKLVKDAFDTKRLEDKIRFVPYNSRKSTFNKELNIVADLGKWHELFFRHRISISPRQFCESYINFLSNKINDSFFSNYERILYIDLFNWFEDVSVKSLKINSKSLDNPLSIILFTIYRYPDLIARLGKLDLVVADSKFNEILKIPSTMLTKDNIPKLKSRISQFSGLEYLDDEAGGSETDMSQNTNSIHNRRKIIPRVRIGGTNPVVDSKEDENENPTSIEPESKPNPSQPRIIQNRVVNRVTPQVKKEEPIEKVIDEIVPVSKEEEIEKRKTTIINSLKKNLIGEVEDISENIISAEERGDDTIQLADDEFDDEVTVAANEYIQENPEVLEGIEDDENMVKELEDFIKKRVYISNIVPEKSQKEIENIEELQKRQKVVIGLPSFSDLESKMVEETDLSSFIDTSNHTIVKSKFVNFDKAYNQKKLVKDIDDSVAALANADYKIFVVDKTEEDTSDQLNLQKTLTYKLEDEKGRKMTLKFDVPIIIEDQYIYLNGSKKIITHQLILKPLVKTAPDAVQIVSFYNKIFITRRGDTDLASSSLKKYLLKYSDKFSVRFGNNIVKNKDYRTSLEFDTVAKGIHSFTIDDNIFITDLDELHQTLEDKKIVYDKDKLSKTDFIVGYNRKTKKVLHFSRDSDFNDYITNLLSEEDTTRLSKTKVGKRLMFAQCTIMRKSIPLVLFMLFCDGFKQVMEKSNIEYRIVSHDEAKEVDPFEYGITPLDDKTIIWKRYPLQNSLIMNGLQSLPLELYSVDELESKETYIYLMSQFYAYTNMSFNLDQYKDFMIDNVTKEVLMDFDLPTDLVSLMAYAVTLLVDNDFIPENDLRNMRIRSNELIAFHTYNAVAAAYNNYRKTQHKRNPSKVSIKRDAVMIQLKKSKLVEENSVLNPILELEKNRSVTYKGERGINLTEAMTLSKRGYDESMLGVLGISTSPDANVGVVRQLTLEPNITSTRGYIQTTGLKNVDNLNAANLLTPAELLTPLGVQHDDPTRTSMAYKQSKYMLMVEDAEPAMIGNKVEAIIPHHMSDEFTIVAKDDGVVIDDVNGVKVVQYKDGTYKSIDTNPAVKKNAASGFFVMNTMKMDKGLGDKVKKGEVLAHNDKAFSANASANDVAMNLGVLVKVAVVPNWDIFEDSKPITKRMSERMATTMIDEKRVSLDKDTHIDYMVNIGDEVTTGDVLIKFDSSPDDPFAATFLAAIREDQHESIIADNMTTITSNFTGVITDIKMYSTVELNELSPSLKKVVKQYYRRLNSKIKTLNKYSNEGDSKYYKSGTLITEAPERIEPNVQGKIKGVKVDEGVFIAFFIKYTGLMAKGDKSCSEFALKGIVSHVIEEGQEPYSEYNPDEEISTLIAPLSISARKTPSLFLAMFGNKLLIEAKKQLEEIYMKN